MNRTFFYIDGNNVYKTFKKMGVVLNPAQHIKFINFVCNGFKERHNLDLDFKKLKYYNSIPDIRDGENNYLKHMKFIDEMRVLDPKKVKVITRGLQRINNKIIIEEKKKVIEELKLCKKCKGIIKKNCSKCVGFISKREKGIDVKIAIDMVSDAHKEKFDFCVLISGDSDFIPALTLVKDLKKTPLSSFFFSKEKGENYYSYDLRRDFKSFFFDKDTLIPNL